MKALHIRGQDYLIHYEDTPHKNASARIRQNAIVIKLPARWPDHERMKAAEQLEKRIVKKLHMARPSVPLLSLEEKKAIALQQLPRITERVRTLNALHFQAQMGKIRIRANISLWGSCSPQNNITLNFTLLFLPEALLDYVIVHELAHTKIRSHSQRFWHEVEKVLPDYRERKRELRRYLLRN